MTDDLPGLPPADGHAGDLLSAHLDGELDQPAATWVRSHLDDCEPCRAAAAEAAAARDWIRALPAVDASPLVEGLLARHRSTIRLGATFVGLATLALGVLALSSAVIRTDVVPDIDGMVAAHVASAPSTGSTATGAAESQVGAMGELGKVRRVEAVGRHYSAPAAMIGNRATLSRRAMFDGRDLAIVVYGDGRSAVSVFQQLGRLRWDHLPAGSFETIGTRQVWSSERGPGEPVVMVTEAGHVVITVVSDDAAAVRTVMGGLPDIARGSAWERIHDACSRLTEVFAVGE